MSNRSRIASLAAAAMLLAGCYHATVVAELPAGTTGVHKEWLASWVFRLIPPSEDLSSAKECPNGVAKVETQWSFLNGLVHVVTFEIYGPMQVDVTCASSSKMGEVPAGAAVVKVAQGATADQLKAAFEEASARSEREHVPAFVMF